MMEKRDLANREDNAVSFIVTRGADFWKTEMARSLGEDYLLHQNCRVHMHDAEFFSIAYNCLGVSVSDFVESKADFHDACRQLYRGIVELTNRQFGGIGVLDFDTGLGIHVGNETDEELERNLRDLLDDLNLNVRKGCEKAYVTFNFGTCIEEGGRRVTAGLLRAYQSRTYIFPNLVFKLKAGVNLNSEDPNYDLFYLTSEVTASCMNPTYLNLDAPFNRGIALDEFGIMGCRTRIADNRFHGRTALHRGNIAAATINLVQIAFECRENPEQFLPMLDETMKAALRMLEKRYHCLLENGMVDHLIRDKLYVDSEFDNREEMLKNGTLSVGFIGLWDALSVLHSLRALTPALLEQYLPDALSIVEHMRSQTDAFAREKDLNISLLASSAEGVTGFFCEHDRENYSGSEIVCEKGHYTNSFHVPVSVEISAFQKIQLEAPFHELCNGGHITYVELDDVPVGNADAVRDLVGYAFNRGIGYFGINFPLDVCRECGTRGSFDSVCPYCGSVAIRRLRRVSGYLSDSDLLTPGKMAELQHRRHHKLT